MLSAAKHLSAYRDRPFAALRVTQCDCSNCQVLFFQLNLALFYEPLLSCVASGQSGTLDSHGLTLQATLQVQPADKRLSLVLSSSLVIGPALIERFDSEEASNLLTRKTHLLELPNVRHGGELLSEFHGHPPVSPSHLVRAGQ